MSQTTHQLGLGAAPQQHALKGRADLARGLVLDRPLLVDELARERVLARHKAEERRSGLDVPINDVPLKDLVS